MEDKDQIVKDSLSEFLVKQGAADSVSYVDDIVLSYIVGVLEELGCEEADDTFDVETFTEMMEAYLPGFSHNDHTEVCEWMVNLATTLHEKKEEKLSTIAPAPPPSPTDKLLVGFKEESKIIFTDTRQTSRKKNKARLKSCSSDDGGDARSRQISESNSEGKKSRQISESSDHSEGSECINQHCETEGDVKMLLEMFPACCSMELSHCLSLSSGDVEKAAQLVLHRQETGNSIINTLPQTSHQASSKKKTKPIIDDKKLKQNLLARFSYVDVDEDKKQHKPTLSKKHSEPKKLVRYLDSRVVSTKGERFTEIKKPEDEDLKKTYVSLKPAKQYRFH